MRVSPESRKKARLMNLEKPVRHLVLALLLILLATPAWGEYVADVFEVTLRTGPSTSHKIVAMLKSGQAVQVLEEGEGWTRVKVSSGPGAGNEGWLLSRFLMKRAPYEALAQKLQQENAELKEKLATLENHWSTAASREKQLSQELAETSQAIESLRSEYETLKEGASEYLELKAQFEETRAALESAEETVKKLAMENENLRFSQKIKWFVTGAAVLLCGWVIGLIMGRQQKKRRAAYL